MRVAIYVRKSNSDDDKAVDDKSVERQIAHAKLYIKRKGWVLADDDSIFIDDNVSGIEFNKRPGLLRLLNRLGEFDAIVMSEQSRLGREISNMGVVIAKIISSGVRIFFYLTETELKYETAAEKFMASAVSFANEMERELASQRARDAAYKRARELRNFGGRVYGYKNVWRLPDGTRQTATSNIPKPVDAQTIYEIEKSEAKTVVGICKMYKDGFGQKLIAYTLNGTPAHDHLLRKYFGGKRPPPPRGNSEYWSPTTIHDILRNPRYTGHIPYGATRKKLVPAKGTKCRVKDNLQLFDAPSLRIIDENLAEAVKTRVTRMSRMYLRSPHGQLQGRPDGGRASKYLLSGFVKCENCKSSMIATSYKSGTGNKRRTIRCYVCNFRSNRGPMACANNIRPALDDLNSEVLAAFERQILTPTVIRYAVRAAMKLIRERTHVKPERKSQLLREIQNIERKLKYLVGAIAAGNTKPESIMAEIAEKEAQLKILRNELVQTETPDHLDQYTDTQIEQHLAGRALRWREVLAGDVPLARQALRALLAGPIWFVAEKSGAYELRGKTRLGALWEDEVGASVKMASPRGISPFISRLGIPVSGVALAT